MMRPCRVVIDDECGLVLTYIYYVDPAELRTELSRLQKITPNVRRGECVADVDEHGSLLGIELLDMTAETLRQAETLAAEYGAIFPSYLRAV